MDLLWVLLVLVVVVGVIAAIVVLLRREAPAAPAGEDVSPALVAVEPEAAAAALKDQLQKPEAPAVAVRSEPQIAPKVRESLSPDMLRQLTELISKFPPLSPITSQIVAEINSPDTNRQKIVQLVSQDPMLTMQLLRLANSAAAAQTREVTSHEQAILLLGYDTVLTVAMRGTIAGLAARSSGQGFDQQALMRHNVVTGLMSGALAKRSSLVSPGEAVTAGLLHDVGKVVMDISYPQLVKLLLDQKVSRLGESRLGKEERLFGASHALQGAVLASRWALPASLVNSIELHHHPAVSTMEDYPAKDRELTAVVFIANQLAKYAGCPGDDNEVDLASPELLAALNLPQTYEAIMELVRPEIRKQLAVFIEDMATPKN